MNNYIEQALRTKSDKFYGNKVSLIELQIVLTNCVRDLQELDAIKKSLFYGKPYRNSEQTFSPNAGHVAVAIGAQTSPQTDAFDIVHCIIGKATEAGELLEHLLDVANGEKTFDVVNFKEELGDGQWYDAIGAAAVFSTFDELQVTNIAKLKARFPNKFTEQHAENRDLFVERQVLNESNNV